MSAASPVRMKKSPIKDKAQSAQANVIVSRSPGTGRELGQVQTASSATIGVMVAAARQAQAGWDDLGLRGRLAMMRKLKNVLYENADSLIDTLVAEAGKPTFEATLEFWASMEALVYNIGIGPRTLAPRRELVRLMPHHKHRIEHRPYGVVLVIAPWNFPLFLSLPPIIAALIAGNAVIYKPSEFATQMGEAIAQVVVKAGLPAHVFQVAQGAGDIGAALIREHPNKIVFTGSPGTARKIAAAAGELLIPLTLELGGKDAAIVLEDADLNRTAAGITWAGMLNAGQACVSIERIYVRREVADLLVEKMAKVMNDHIRLGPGEAPSTTMGAITTDAQMDIIDSQVREAVGQGARIILGGHAAEDQQGSFYLPTLITDVTPNMRIARQETFGPVIVVVPVDSDEEALRLANDSPYGLTGSVWTRNRARGLALARRMKVGQACVNDHVLATSAPNLPWGGNNDSGYGRTGGAQGLLDMTVAQVLTTERFKPVPREPFWYPYTPLKQKLVRRAINILYAPGLLNKLRALFR
jgi:acyl-CoA reductase-like NAD-dependent aldehyde dehydrogenase